MEMEWDLVGSVFAGIILAFVVLFWAMGKLHKLSKGPRALMSWMFVRRCSCRHRGSKHCACPCRMCRRAYPKHRRHRDKKVTWTSAATKHASKLVMPHQPVPVVISKLEATPVPSENHGKCHG